MTMTPHLRKFILTTHITFSVGWLGAVVAYLALAIIGLTSEDTKMINVVYPALELIGWYVIVPSSLLALLTGLIQSLFTPWGLFQYYWIAVKFTLTFVASIILVNHMSTAVNKMANIVLDGRLSSPDFGMLRIQLLIHAIGGLLILIFATVLSVYKPWGKTPYGLRKQQKNKIVIEKKLWKWPFYGLIGLVLLLFVLHLLSRGLFNH